MLSNFNDIIAALDKGWATLIAASLAAIVSFISLFISILSARSQTRLAGEVSNWTNINKEKREYKFKQLTSFYDPIYTLLLANNNIFDRIGPTSIIRKSELFNDKETAELMIKRQQKFGLNFLLK